MIIFKKRMGKMDIRTAKVSYTKKINLGDYESAEATVSLEATIENEGIIEAVEVLRDLCRHQVHLALEVDKEGTANPYTKRHFKYGKLTSEETIPLMENLADLPF